MLEMRKMKDSGIEWIGEIPEGWSIARGKHILTLLQRAVFPTDGVITCFRDGEVTLRSNRREDGFTVSLKEIGYQGIEPGDLVVHGMDGFAGSIGISDSRGKSSPVLVVLDSSQDKKYLMYYLRSMAYNNVFLALSTGIRVRSCDLKWNKLADLLYLVPPIVEQHKLVSFLDEKCSEIDAMLSKTHSSIEEYKKLKQAVITQTVTKGVRGDREMKDSGVEWIGEIPAEWSICPLKRLAAIQTGSTPSKTSSESFYSSIAGTPWIKPDNLGFSSSIETTAEFLTEEGCSVARTLPSNTVYVGCIGSRIGNCGYSLIPCACNQQINALIFNARMYWKYGWYLTIFQEEQYMLLANGNVIQIINSTTQGNISCIVPSISEQREITAYLDAKCAEIDGLIAKKEQLVKELETYKKSLIYEVVTGKREV